MTATGLGSTLQDHRATLDLIAGTVIVALGVLFVVTPFVPRLNREWRPDVLIAARRLGRPAGRRRGVRGRVDPVRRPDARRDPHRRLVKGTVGEGGAAAGLLLGGPGGAVHAHRRRLQPRDDRVPLAARPLDDRHGGLGLVLIAMGVLLLTGELTRLNGEAQQALDSIGLNVFKSL